MSDLPVVFLVLVLQSVVIPFGVALAVLAGSRAMRLGPLGPALAIAAGFTAAYFAVLHSQWSLVPKEAMDWLPWIALAGAAGAAAIEGIGSAALRIAARLALSGAMAALVVSPALASVGAQRALIVALGTALLTCAAWTYLAQAAVKRPTPPWLTIVVAGGAGLALMIDSSQSMGQLCAALASVLVAGVAFNFRRVRTAFPPEAAGASILLLGTLLANAYVYAEFPLGYIALLLGGLAADPVIAGLNRARNRSCGMGSWATAVVLTAIPTVLTVAMAVKAAIDLTGP